MHHCVPPGAYQTSSFTFCCFFRPFCAHLSGAKCTGDGVTHAKLFRGTTFDGMGGGLVTRFKDDDAFQMGLNLPISPRPVPRVVLFFAGILLRIRSVDLSGGSAIVCHLFVFFGTMLRQKNINPRLQSLLQLYRAVIKHLSYSWVCTLRSNGAMRWASRFALTCTEHPPIAVIRSTRQFAHICETGCFAETIKVPWR